MKGNGFKLAKKKKKRRRYPAQTITDVDSADDIVFLANTPDQAESDNRFTNYNYLSEATVANFQNNGKILIWCVDKALLSDVKKFCTRKVMP